MAVDHLSVIISVPCDQFDGELIDEQQIDPDAPICRGCGRIQAIHTKAAGGDEPNAPRPGFAPDDAVAAGGAEPTPAASAIRDR